MRAIDTNVLVRLLARDDARQLKRAEEFTAKGAWVSHLVVAETSWVLESVYGRTREEIITAITMLLDHEHLAIQDPDVIEAALAGFRKNKNVSFSDLLILEIARKNGHLPWGASIANARRLRTLSNYNARPASARRHLENGRRPPSGR